MNSYIPMAIAIKDPVNVKQMIRDFKLRGGRFIQSERKLPRRLTAYDWEAPKDSKLQLQKFIHDSFIKYVDSGELIVHLIETNKLGHRGQLTFETVFEELLPAVQIEGPNIHIPAYVGVFTNTAITI